VGYQALLRNTAAANNTAVGEQALFNDTGTRGGANTAVGHQALYNNTTGFLNTAIGYQAGSSITGDTNICIGQGVSGTAGVDGTTWIGNVYFSVASERAVYIDRDNKLGTLSSSRRYKEQIKPMEHASETIFALKPVTFRYKKEIDPSRALSFGLIAEDVAEVNPDLITRDQNGNPQTVRYDAANAMLLNEFLKEHRKVEQMQKQIEALTAGLRRVSAQLELSKPAPQVVNNP
jgi:hypothetical protein